MKKFNSIFDISDYILERQNKLRKYISVRMFIGYGDKKQYKDRLALEKEIDLISSKYTPKNDNELIMLYFGDVPKKEEPDIGYVYEYFSKLRPNVKVIMIQIKEMEKYGVPEFVDGVYFHSDYNKNDSNHKWGGFEKVNGEYKVYSNTKQWLMLHLLLKKLRRNLYKKHYNKNDIVPDIDTSGGLDRCTIFGKGGPISQQEIKLINMLNIDNLEPRFGLEKDDIEIHNIKKLESRY
jgi:hypothetical protein